MEKNLTVGKPFSVLVKYVLPLFGSIIFQQLYNIADSLIAGRFIGTDALASVGNSYEITLIFIAFAFGCNIGTSVVVARFFGQEDKQKVKSAVYTSAIFGLILGIVLTAVGLAVTVPLLKAINTPLDIIKSSSEYLYIYIGGFLFLLLYNIATGIFAALGDSKTPFIMLATSSVANVIMDIIFVKYFNMGVPGVAWATFLCQGICGLIAIIYALVRTKKLYKEKVKKFDLYILKEIVGIAVPSMLQQLFISVGNIIIQGFINNFGTSAIGGYAAAVKLNNMTITSISAVGNGMSNYTAQNLGANKPKRINQGFVAGLTFSGICAALFTILYIVFREDFIKLFITDGNQEAVNVGTKFILIVAPFYVFISVKLIADGILRGANRMGFFMISTFVDLIIRVAFSAVFAKTIGINGIWWSWPIGWLIALLISLVLYSLTIKGLKKYYIEEDDGVLEQKP